MKIYIVETEKTNAIAIRSNQSQTALTVES